MKQLVDMIEAVAYEKGMPKDVVRQAMEGAIASLARKENKEPGATFEAEINDQGEVAVWRKWLIVDNVMDEDIERLPLENEEVGTTVYEEAEVPKWTRTGLQVVKQVLAQRLKQGLRQTIAQAWQNRVGEVVLGTVKRIDKSRVIVDLGEPAEGVIGPKQRIPGEMFKVGHRVRAVVHAVNDDHTQGAVIELSRTSETFLSELISMEVPEVGIGQVVIKAIARDPGSRAKVAVIAGPGLRHHPAAVCVGMRGVRAQAISGELNGERMEFVEWHEEPARFLLNALEPAEVTSLLMDEDTKTARVGVNHDKLARAIGGRGQNVRLASRLTGWNVQLMSTEEYNAKMEEDRAEAVAGLMTHMDMDEEMAGVLFEEGFASVDEIYQSSLGDLMSIDGIDEDTAHVLKERAHDVILTRMIEESKPTGLATLHGITDEDIDALHAEGVQTLEELADLAVDDIAWSENDRERLGAWIMQARRHIGMI